MKCVRKTIIISSFFYLSNLTSVTRNKVLVGGLVGLLSVSLLTSSIFSGLIIALSSSSVTMPSSPIAAVMQSAAAQESLPSNGEAQGPITPLPRPADRPPAPPPFKWIPSEQATRDGCKTGGFKEREKVDPEWVSVSATASGPAQDPELTVAEGYVESIGNLKSYVAWKDWPYNHNSHDVIWNVKLDPLYQPLNSDANEDSSEPGNKLLHSEWEMRYLPVEFWPVAGDRVWMLGWHVWDCGHFKWVKDDPNCQESFPTEIPLAPSTCPRHPTGYTTEMHPPLAVAFTRNEPTIFSGDAAPTNTYKTYININNEGGFHNYPVFENGIRTNTVSGGVRQFLDAYEFNIPLPPKPPGQDGSPEPELRMEVVYANSDVRPELTLDMQNNVVHVAIRNPRCQEGATAICYNAIVAVGWHEQVLSQGYREIEVRFNSLRINNVHDAPDAPASLPFPLRDVESVKGKWHLWVRAGTQWLSIPSLENRRVTSGETIQIGKTVILYVPEDYKLGVKTIDLEPYSPDSILAIQASGWQDGTISKIFGVRQQELTAMLLDAMLGYLAFERPVANVPIGTIDKSIREIVQASPQTSAFVSLSSTANWDLEEGEEEFEGDEEDLGRLKQLTEGDYSLNLQIVQNRYFPKGMPNTRDAIATVTFENVKVIDSGIIDSRNNGGSNNNTGNIASNPLLNATNEDNVNNSDIDTAIEPRRDFDLFDPCIGVAAPETDPRCRTAKMEFTFTVNEQRVRFPSSGTIDIPLSREFSLLCNNQVRNNDTTTTTSADEIISVPQNDIFNSSDFVARADGTAGDNGTGSVDVSELSQPPSSGVFAGPTTVQPQCLHSFQIELHGEPLVLNVEAKDHTKQPPEDPGFPSCRPTPELVCPPITLPPKLTRSYDYTAGYGIGRHTEQSDNAFYGEYFEISYRIEVKPIGGR